MAFRSADITVSTTATLLLAAQAGDVEVWINADPNADYYLGGSVVTVASGLHLFGRGVFRSDVRPGDELWAVVGGSPVTTNVLVRSA